MLGELKKLKQSVRSVKTAGQKCLEVVYTCARY